MIPAADQCLGQWSWWAALRGLAIMGIMAAVLFFYSWTVKTAAVSLEVHGQQRDYYNLLVDGFQAGHLYMQVPPHPDLLALPAAQRPGSAPFLLDASLYAGHYYLYFGVVPAVTLYWPFAVFTGHDLPEGWAALVFASVAFGFAVWWWWDLRRIFITHGGIFWDVGCILALGLCTVLPSTLRRPMFYEVAILAGWAFGLIGLWALTRAGLFARRAYLYLLLAGVAIGLAIGSRPNLAPAGLLTLLAGCIMVVVKRTPPEARWGQRFLLSLGWAGCGVGLIGLGLAGYNYARFGDILEFGHTYQLGIKPIHLFHAANFWHNLRLYYFAPPQISGYFPFVAPAEEPSKPEDYVGRESAHGEWVWGVLFLCALGLAVRAWWPRRAELRPSLPLAGPPIVWFATNLLVTCLTGVRANRYMVDFHPALVLVTLFLFGVGLNVHHWSHRWARGAVGLGLLFAALFNVFASMQVHDFFSKTDPVSYKKIAKLADDVAWRLAPSFFSEVGDRELELYWPPFRGSNISPLVSTGPSLSADGIWVHADGEGRARFVFQHWDYGETNGPWFSIKTGQSVRVRIAGAFLLPPQDHAWYGNRPDYVRAMLKHRLRISVDGQVRFDRDVPSFNSAPWQLRWGEWQLGGQGIVHRYEGSMRGLRLQPIDEAWLAGSRERRGSVRLRLKLPSSHLGLVQPLLQTGIYPTCDMLMVHLTRPGFVQLIHDRFGAGAYRSEEFAVDYGRGQTVEVEMPSANDGLGRPKLTDKVDQLRVRWNGREVLASPLGIHHSRPQDLVVGANLVNASGCRPLFADEILLAPFLSRLPTTQRVNWEYTFNSDDTLIGTSGAFLIWQREDQPVVGLVWRRAAPSEPAYLGWLDEGRIIWAEQPLAGGVASVRVYLALGVASTNFLPLTNVARGLIKVEQGGRPVLSAHTDYLADGAPSGWAIDGQRWISSAPQELAATMPRADELPGQIRLRFELPDGGLIGAEPLLCAGVSGAADGIYLRPIGPGLYVVGLDHWGAGARESAPVLIPSGEVHTLSIELGSLFPSGQVAADLVRVHLNDKIVLEAKQVLHPAKAGQVVVGRNTLGMSTSGPLFHGVIYSVRSIKGSAP